MITHSTCVLKGTKGEKKSGEVNCRQFVGCLDGFELLLGPMKPVCFPLSAAHNPSFWANKKVVFLDSVFMNGCKNGQYHCKRQYCTSRNQFNSKTTCALFPGFKH